MGFSKYTTPEEPEPSVLENVLAYESGNISINFAPLSRCESSTYRPNSSRTSEGVKLMDRPRSSVESMIPPMHSLKLVGV